MVFLDPFVYHPLVLVLVQELLAVSVISFRGVVAQLFGCSLNRLPSLIYFKVSTTITQEPVTWFDGCWGSSEIFEYVICWPSTVRLLCYNMFTRKVSSVKSLCNSSRSSAPYYILCQISLPVVHIMV